MVIWIILLLASFSILSILASSFRNSPDSRTIISVSWAGYTISKNYNPKIDNVTTVEASWTVPQVSTSTTEGRSSVWIGIGGQNDKTLIQVGTEQDFVTGQATYYAWYELLPSGSIKIPNLSITPGDEVSASINLLNSETNTWNITLSDISTGQSFSKNVVYGSSLASGEWIVERPSINGQITNLCDFGVVFFRDCTISVNNLAGAIGNFTYYKIGMVNQDTAKLADVSALSQDDLAFNVSYVAGS